MLCSHTIIVERILNQTYITDSVELSIVTKQTSTNKQIRLSGQQFDVGVNVLVLINKVALHWARLGSTIRMDDCLRTGKPFWNVTNHQGQLSLPFLGNT